MGLAEIAYQRDELDLALRHATEGIALCRQFVYTPPLADGLATLAMIRQATGDPARALEAISEAGQASPGPAGLLNPVPAQRARLLLAQGDLAGAARFPQENGLGPDDEPDYAREPGHLALARVLLAQDRPGQALALLDRLHAAAVAQGRVGSLIEIGALRALALAASGEEAGGGRRAGRGAHAGLPAGLCPGLRRRGAADGRAAGPADRGPAVRRGRRRRCRSAAWPGSSARLAPGHARGCRARQRPAVPGLVEPLTSRELEVLRCWRRAGRTRPSPASSWSPSTPSKKHVSHVLGKLGAANRTEAVTRATGAQPDPLTAACSFRSPHRTQGKAGPDP